MDMRSVRAFILLGAVASVCYGDGLSHTDSRSLYSRYNLNKDRCLDKQEFSKIFTDMDTWPEDQQISKTEFMSGWRIDHLHNPENVPFYFELVDHSPRDNEITMHEITALFNNMFDNEHSGCVSSSRFSFVWSALFVKESDYVVTGVWCDGGGVSHKDSHALFSHYATNSEHCLNLQEFSKIFMDFDTWPEDQQISRTEFIQGWRTDHLNEPQDVPFYFELVDHSPRDNEITMHEVTELFNHVFLDGTHHCVTSSRFEFVWSALFGDAKD